MKNIFSNHSKNWFSDNLIIRPFLQVNEIENRHIFGNIDIVINVSGTFDDIIYSLIQSKNVQYFWFPIREDSYDMGLNSLYGALKIIHLAEKKNKKVILHCLGGNNRSRTVAEAYYYLRFHKHIEDPYKGYKSHLFYNCENNFLLPIERMEFFLLNFENYRSFDELYEATMISK
ncbi:dual specificity protein phosphatase family protein [Bacteroidales bacterium OttesenSCG-928-A17]|nr:dual specificity protein phosphatase family protein [Bacteroidales bacterium OttesenSCG-928-A17]